MRALIVDDDPTYRRILAQSLQRIGVTEVAMAGEIELAMGKLEREVFDVVTIDVVLRGETGLDLMKWVRVHRPALIALLVTSGSAAQASSAVDGLLLGATAVILKPSGPDAPGELDRRLGAALALAERQATDRLPRVASLPLPTLPRASAPLASPGPRELVALGASTGGPAAVLLFLSSLPAEFRAPIVITQHMSAPHVPHLAKLLRERSGLAVAVAEEGEPVESARVYIAPGGAHLRVVRRGARLVLTHDHGEEEHFCRPAVDPMFRSVAAACGASALGVVLTGMGSDGAAGAVALREHGALVIVQDRASSVVWGMPGAVVARGAADMVAPVVELAQWTGATATPNRHTVTWRSA